MTWLGMILHDVPVWIAVVYLFTVGCVVGSFLNVCVHRLPMHHGYLEPLRHLWSPPSRCPRCMTPILTSDNIPILGWLRLGGRCRACRTKISIRYPAIELFNGLLVVALYFLNVPAERYADLSEAWTTSPFGPSGSDSLLNEFWLAHARFLFHWLLCELLFVAALIDLDLTIIPAVVTDPWIVVGIVCSTVGGLWLWPLDFDLPYGLADPELLNEALKDPNSGLVPGWMRAYPVAHGVAVSLAGAAVGFVTVWSIRLIGTKIIGVEAVGAGDVWLMAMVGSFIGWQPALIAMVLSLFFAIGTVAIRLIAGRFEPIPYGPYLSLGSATTVMGWHWIWPRAAQVFDLGPAFLGTLGVIMLVMLAAMLWVIQVVKRVLGISTYSDELLLWRPSDQHMYQAGERPRPDVGQWQAPARWPGTESGRGQWQERQWRCR